MPSIRKALALSFASKYSSLAIHTAAVMVLARLLTPAEIGVYSVGAAVVALAHVVRDFGVGNYRIQEKELTAERISAALDVVVLIAWAIAAKPANCVHLGNVGLMQPGSLLDLIRPCVGDELHQPD